MEIRPRTSPLSQAWQVQAAFWAVNAVAMLANWAVSAPSVFSTTLHTFVLQLLFATLPPLIWRLGRPDPQGALMAQGVTVCFYLLGEILARNGVIPLHGMPPIPD